MRNYIKGLIVSLAFCGSAFSCYAQSVYYSPDIKFGFRNSEFDVVGRLEHKNITYRSNAKAQYLDIFTDSMQPIAQV